MTTIFKYLSLSFCIYTILSLLYDYSTFTQIICHYPYFDIRYYMFIGIQFLWVTFLYQIIYQYICLYPMMKTRLSHQACLKILLKQFMIYSSCFLIFHSFIFWFIFQRIPWIILFFNLMIQYFAFICTIFLKKYWNYSYILIIIIIICTHFVV